MLTLLLMLPIMLYTLLPIHDDGDNGDQEGTEEEIEEEYLICFMPLCQIICIINKTLVLLCHLYYCFSPQACTTYELFHKY